METLLAGHEDANGCINYEGKTAQYVQRNNKARRYRVMCRAACRMKMHDATMLNNKSHCVSVSHAH